jgi:hypothetical protein
MLPALMADPIADPPGPIADLAASCVRFVKLAVGIELDYTPETLPILDHYLRGAHGVSREEVLGLVVPAAGAYFGEVVRRHLGDSAWHLVGEDYGLARLEFQRWFLSFNPIGIALETVLGEEVAGSGSHLELLHEDRQLVREALDRAGDVRNEDYFRLAVRFEVLELVTALLSDKASQSDDPSRTFGPDVYAALRDSPRSTLH